MRKHYGSPRMFAFKVIAAVPEFISGEEAEAAILRYEKEYEAAPESDRLDQIAAIEEALDNAADDAHPEFDTLVAELGRLYQAWGINGFTGATDAQLAEIAALVRERLVGASAAVFVSRLSPYVGARQARLPGASAAGGRRTRR